jgi:hypothetical protein
VVTGSAPLVVRYETPKPDQCDDTAPTGTYRGPVSATVDTKLAGAPTQVGGAGGHSDVSGQIELTYKGNQVSGTVKLGGGGESHVGPPSDKTAGVIEGTVSGSATDPIVTGRAAGTGGNSPFRLPLGVTSRSCASVSGDIVAFVRSIYAFYGAGPLQVQVSGKGGWTIPRATK